MFFLLQFAAAQNLLQPPRTSITVNHLQQHVKMDSDLCLEIKQALADRKPAQSSGEPSRDAPHKTGQFQVT